MLKEVFSMLLGNSIYTSTNHELLSLSLSLSAPFHSHVRRQDKNGDADDYLT